MTVQGDWIDGMREAFRKKEAARETAHADRDAKKAELAAELVKAGEPLASLVPMLIDALDDVIIAGRCYEDPSDSDEFRKARALLRELGEQPDH